MKDLSTFTERRVSALASVIIYDGTYEFEGQPNLKKIDDLLAELTKDRMIYYTVAAARSQGYPAVMVHIDGPTFTDCSVRYNWKCEVRKAISNLERELGGTVACTVISYSDGTSCDTTADSD